MPHLLVLRARRRPRPGAPRRRRPSVTCSRAGCSRPTRPRRCRTPPTLGLAGAAPDLRGGETAGLARLRGWRDGGLADYAAERNDVERRRAPRRASRRTSSSACSRRAAASRWRRAAGARKWRAELLWRDWFKYVLHHHPDLAERSVDPRYERLEWPGTDAHFEAWCRGETGYGLVDAGMRQLVRDRLAAQPRAHGLRELPGQGPARGLAPRRALLPRAPDRRRPLVERRQLAVGGGHGPRRRAVLPRLQPRPAGGALRSRTAPTCAAGRRTARSRSSTTTSSAAAPSTCTPRRWVGRTRCDSSARGASRLPARAGPRAAPSAAGERARVRRRAAAAAPGAGAGARRGRGRARRGARAAGRGGGRDGARGARSRGRPRLDGRRRGRPGRPRRDVAARHGRQPARRRRRLRRPRAAGQRPGRHGAARHGRGAGRGRGRGGVRRATTGCWPSSCACATCSARRLGRRRAGRGGARRGGRGGAAAAARGARGHAARPTSTASRWRPCSPACGCRATTCWCSRGSARVVASLAEDADVRLGEVVEHVEHGPDGVRVTTTAGRARGASGRSSRCRSACSRRAPSASIRRCPRDGAGRAGRRSIPALSTTVAVRLEEPLAPAGVGVREPRRATSATWAVLDDALEAPVLVGWAVGAAAARLPDDDAAVVTRRARRPGARPGRAGAGADLVGRRALGRRPVRARRAARSSRPASIPACGRPSGAPSAGVSCWRARRPARSGRRPCTARWRAASARRNVV